MKKEKLSLEEEKKLVEKAKDDANAFGTLYDMYIDDVYLYIFYKIGNEHDAEDLTARTFEKAMKAMQGYEWRGYTFGAWLYTIARNLILDRYKKKKLSISVEDVMTFTADVEIERVDEKAEREINAQKLMKKIAELPENQREVIYLRYVKELTIAETMEITGRSIDSVKSLAKRGLKKLRELMDN
ncbi:sigma-70 family RNA polymerase sigma factor [Candidatus Dojkabacteria bacterium]|nr:sigma-70 family RNA polymerase sigma factor [Candidatus Dojkabacteria bacterium]